MPVARACADPHLGASGIHGSRRWRTQIPPGSRSPVSHSRAGASTPRIVKPARTRAARCLHISMRCRIRFMPGASLRCDGVGRFAGARLPEQRKQAPRLQAMGPPRPRTRRNNLLGETRASRRGLDPDRASRMPAPRQRCPTSLSAAAMRRNETLSPARSRVLSPLPATGSSHAAGDFAPVRPDVRVNTGHKAHGAGRSGRQAARSFTEGGRIAQAVAVRGDDRQSVSSCDARLRS